ncbi:SagB/ThcOx family dehydrogenase [Paraclostridium ghonii]|uniref:SagB-type dehydrogenase family enzyme n=1 Tax=Paraclostridium ghonii TaxID=29358 RepID=A0ABU0MY90_9FIRM|nr:nitroreductase family protein [Paeniclostridium ghonii]MDQ0555882.1 SagB-type dehydrogenase family enzyme [Paeniclostridium ghonii]
MWEFGIGKKLSKGFLDYHFSSLNEPEFTGTQIYKHIDREKQKSGDYPLIDLKYNIDYNSSLEKTLIERKTAIDKFKNNQIINKDLISKFTQLAFIGGAKDSRNYPSGGGQYYVDINILFNESNVDKELVDVGNVMNLNCDTHKLIVKNKLSWEIMSKAFIQDYMADTAQFAIVLSCDIENISKKYMDISYKLVQQETGHIGQNIQLVANYLNIESVPLGGFYDIELSNTIGDNQTVLYAFLLG